MIIVMATTIITIIGGMKFSTLNLQSNFHWKFSISGILNPHLALVACSFI